MPGRSAWPGLCGGARCPTEGVGGECEGMLGKGGGGREDIPWPQVKLGAVPQCRAHTVSRNI